MSAYKNISSITNDLILIFIYFQNYCNTIKINAILQINNEVKALMKHTVFAGIYKIYNPTTFTDGQKNW